VGKGIGKDEASFSAQASFLIHGPRGLSEGSAIAGGQQAKSYLDVMAQVGQPPRLPCPL
jgi:hypothetical protein